MRIGLALTASAAYFPLISRVPAFTPASLFASGEQGVWFDPSDLTTLFQDSAGTTPVTSPGDPVGRILDKSGNGFHATQATSAGRPFLAATPDRITFDRVDDNMSADFTGNAGAYTLLQGSAEGIVHAKVNVPNGAYGFTQDPRFFPSTNITGHILREGELSTANATGAKTYLAENGAGTNFAGVTSMAEWFRLRTDLVELYAGDWDTSSVTSFSAFASGCANLTTLDVSNWDTSSVVSFGQFANACANLTTLDVSNWDTGNVTSFNRFVFGCASLATLDVSSWDTSSVVNFGLFANNCISLTTVTVNGGTGSPFSDSPCTNYNQAFNNTALTQASIDAILVAIEAAGTSGGTFGQSGGSAPSATGEAAVTALRGRGWTVTVTGDF
jgi:surface protein